MRAQIKTDRCPQGRKGDSDAPRQAVFLIANRHYGSVPLSHNSKLCLASGAGGKFNLNQNNTMTQQEHNIEADYYAVYVQRSVKASGSFLLNVRAKGKADALRIARAHGHNLPRWSYAIHIGRGGYFAALRGANR